MILCIVVTKAEKCKKDQKEKRAVSALLGHIQLFYFSVHSFRFCYFSSGLAKASRDLRLIPSLSQCLL